MEKTNEDFKTAVWSVVSMPPTARYAFAKSIQGQEFIKGIQMVAENNKPSDKQFGMSWTVEEIDELNEAVIHASPEDQEIIFSLLPGPVASIIHNRMSQNKIDKPDYSNWTKVKGDAYQNIKTGKDNKDVDRKVEKAVRIESLGPQYFANGIIQKDEELEKGIRGPVKGTPGYDKWLASRRGHQTAKVGPDVMTRPTKTRKTPYKHFTRQVKRNAKIVDKKTSEKSEKSY